MANAVNKVADRCADAAGAASAYDDAEYAAALLAIAAIVGWILGGIFGMMEDDFMCQRTISFDAAALQNFAQKEDWWLFKNPDDSGAAILKVYFKLGPVDLFFESDIDAAFSHNGKAFFFKGNQYIRYDLDSDRADEGYPYPIGGTTWPGLEPFADGIDAAFSHNGKVFFFKGNQYIRYDLDRNRANEGYPYPIGETTWPGLEPFADGIDAVLNAGNGKAYFFKGNQYIRYDLNRDQADEGYPYLIRDHWI
ncbi:hypothetical protein NIES4103_18580 [Nostoc sp. NIES-4103]|nr:hypothetical protein NIES4103_18580 [Nostoc sp. NIES-4103]